MKHSRIAAVIGGGTMGADIAAIFCAHGWTARVVEPNAARHGPLAERVAASAGQLGKPHDPARLALHESSAEVPWADVALAIETAPEQLEVKQRIFAELERLAPPDLPIGSNSSSFPVSEIARGLATRRRMAGLHFFMPAHLVPAVEVIRGADTDPAVCDALATTMRALGMVPINVKKDIPGFLANRIQHALMREAFALIEAGLATPEDVDNAVRYGFGFRYLAAGPILQKDLAGLDIHCAAAATIYPSLANDAAPANVLRERVETGRLGVKTGEGFFKWTPESIAAEKGRYERALMAALAILRQDQ